MAGGAEWGARKVWQQREREIKKGGQVNQNIVFVQLLELWFAIASLYSENN